MDTALAPQPGKLLSPWQPSVPEFATRNLGLAFFNVAKANMSGPSFAKAFEILSASASIVYFQRAVELEPNNGEYWLDLAVAQNAAGHTADAIQAFQKSIQAQPYDLRAYKGLADLYAQLHRSADSQLVVKKFLERVPQSLTMRWPN